MPAAMIASNESATSSSTSVKPDWCRQQRWDERMTVAHLLQQPIQFGSKTDRGNSLLCCENLVRLASSRVQLFEGLAGPKGPAYTIASAIEIQVPGNNPIAEDGGDEGCGGEECAERQPAVQRPATDERKHDPHHGAADAREQ